MTEAIVIAAVRRFIEENFLYMAPDYRLQEDDSLLRKGVVDSMGVLEVLVFLEETFSIAVADAEVTEHNLGTLMRIAQFVVSKRTDSMAA